MPRERQAAPEAAPPTTADVRAFWEKNPVTAAAISSPPGTIEFFADFERLRQMVEPTDVQEEVYTFGQFAGKAVLDIGCGNGYLLNQYARRGARPCGTDLTWTAIDLSRKRFALDRLDSCFVQADAERLPFRDERFDLVVSAGVLHHIPRTEAAIGEIHRVLKPGGTIILMLYHRNSLHYRLLYPLYGLFHPAFRWHWPAEIARRIDGANNPIGNTYTRHRVKGLLTGFRDVRLRVASLPIRPLYAVPGGRRVLDLLGRWFGWFLYARAVR